MTVALLWIPFLVWLATMLLYASVPRGIPHPLRMAGTILVVGSTTLAVFAPRADVAYLAAALSTAVLTGAAWSTTRVGATMLALSALGTVAAAVAFRLDPTGAWPFHISLVVLALRCGILPLHGGIVALSQRAPALQARQFATLLVMVFVHLRFADHVVEARELARLVVGVGAASSLFFGFTALARPTLSGFLQGSTLMHGGLLFAAVGAAGRGHHAAALFACVTMALAVGGLAYMILALEARAGTVGLASRHGRARTFPRLTAAFAFLGACGVGMPGTAGFIADDLLLHALWEESVTATVAVALASALLAIATLRAVASVAFGPPRPSVAPDLLPAERRTAVAYVVFLVVIGLLPNLLTASAQTLFGAQR
jgi:NADH-quinone oxidoreductase subunit M